VKSYKVLSNRQIGEATFVLRVERPSDTIKAGQCFSVGTRQLGINREYSMYSSSYEPYLEFLIRRVPDGLVSSTLSELRQGDEVEVGGPYGDFCLDSHSIGATHFVFIASGTGVAPFHSFVRTFPELSYHLYYGVRYESDLVDVGDYTSSSITLCVSRASSSPERVTHRLEKESLNPDGVYYLCGNRQMITDVVSLLRRRGIPGGRIYMETFF